MNADDHKDYSMWSSFFNDHVYAFNLPTLLQMLEDIKDEIAVREEPTIFEESEYERKQLNKRWTK